MHRTSVYLEEDQLQLLKHLAAEERSSVAQMVRRAVDDYLARRLTDDREWSERLNSLLARLGERVGDVPPDEIEAEITAARREVREIRRIRHASSGR